VDYKGGVMHTKGPWKVGSPKSVVGILIYRDDGPGVNYRRICRNVDTTGDADFIVSACNCHEELLEALKAMCALFDDEGELREQHQDQISVALELAEKAINKATGNI
jgi:hypothetical protein